MLRRLNHRMSETEFLEWQLNQEERYELVDGEPHAMTGARVSHDRVVSNTSFAIRRSLQDINSLCETFTADIAVRVPAGNLRRPDVAVYCPPFEDDEMVSDRPRLIVEVLSESTQAVDQGVKLQEYMKISSLHYIILVAPLAVDVQIWSRHQDHSWTYDRYKMLNDVILLPDLSIQLPLQDVYRRVNLLPASPLLATESE